MSALPLPTCLQTLGLRVNPFPVTPDEEGIFFSPRLAAQFAELRHFIDQRRGFMLVTGDVGVGKSTLSRLLLSVLDEEGTRTALVFNTFLQGLDLLRAITRDFGLQVEGEGLEAQLRTLNDWLLEQKAQGRNVVLILDDAQGLDVSSLELLRQLSNLEASRQKLLQIVLVAQPEIEATLGRHDLRQLASRIALRLELKPLSLQECDQYLHHRLKQAGNAEAFRIDPAALRLLQRMTGGYIRRIHLLVDRCMYGLIDRQPARIDRKLMLRAGQELGLAPSSSGSRRWLWLSVLGLLLLAGGALLQTAALPGWRAADRLLGARGGPEDLSATRGVLSTEPPDEGVKDPLPEDSTRVAMPEAAAPVEAEPGADWAAFVAAYPGLAWPWAIPQGRQAVLDRLADMPLAGDWWPLLLPSGSASNCQGWPAFDLEDARLTLFRTDLPVEPVPFGTAGEGVRRLQQALQEQGDLAPSAVDGTMGPVTAAALARFQKRQTLLASGQPDVATAYLLSCVPPEGLQ